MTPPPTYEPPPPGIPPPLPPGATQMTLAFVNGAFAAAEVPIYRVPWQKSYSARAISQDLDELLRGSIAVLEGRQA